jgi:hypothetical protein
LLPAHASPEALPLGLCSARYGLLRRPLRLAGGGACYTVRQPEAITRYYFICAGSGSMALKNYPFCAIL